jgi:hypothetical protein
MQRTFLSNSGIDEPGWAMICGAPRDRADEVQAAAEDR